MATRTLSSYRSFAPPRALAAHLECIWVQTVGPGDGTYEQPVLPDGCIDIVWFCDELMLSGPATRPLTLHLAPETRSVGLRFSPGTAPSLVGVSAAELRDQHVALDDLWGRAGAEIAARCLETDREEVRVAILTNALQRRLAEAEPVDPVGLAIASLMTGHPDRSVPALASDMGLSERQLRRRVEDAVGYSPRTLARILRFQRFLAAARASRPGRHLARLAADAGYADQAHLTRESREFAGLPPAAFLEREARRLGD
ncbi:MAG TPA: helix-turn-helix domain-containing protein [Acidimicrobiales bacterium]|nr:helix-turn-helix domain-containing protein [Acidimicrobiales bacterium]